MRKVVIILLSGFFINVAFATATYPEKPNYINLMGGVTFMSPIDKTDSAHNRVVKKSNLGTNFGFALGRHFNKNFRAEISFQYLVTSPRKFEYNNFTDLKNGGSTTIIPIMLNGYYDLTALSNKIIPYVGIGAGGTYTDEDIVVEHNRRLRGNNYTFAGQVIAGIYYHADDQVMVGLEYHYLRELKDRTFLVKDSNGLSHDLKYAYGNDLINLSIMYLF